MTICPKTLLLLFQYLSISLFDSISHCRRYKNVLKSTLKTVVSDIIYLTFGLGYSNMIRGYKKGNDQFTY